LEVRAFGQLFCIDREMKAADTLTLVVGNTGAMTGLNGAWDPAPIKGAPLPKVAPLGFAKPSLAAKPRSIREKDFLKNLLTVAENDKCITN
jgi:hypothetical protein